MSFCQHVLVGRVVSRFWRGRAVLGALIGVGCFFGGPLQVGAAPPPVVDGLIAHYDASALVGLGDGDLVDLWDDVSGNDNHATNEFTPELSPLFSSDAANGLPALEFITDPMSGDRVGSEVETFLDLPDMVDYGSYEFILVAKYNRTVRDPDDMYLIRSNNPVRFRAGIVSNGSYYYRINDPTTSVGEADTEWHIHFISNNDEEVDNLKIFLDANNVGTQTIVIPEDPLLRDVDLGHNPNDGSNTSKDPFDGFIAEVLVYERPLDDDEREAVGFCLAEKYDLESDFPVGAACPMDEVECPEPDIGDTHCRQIEISGPAGNAPGLYTVTVTAEDDSGDGISYTFRADNGVDPALEFRRPSNETGLDLGEGTWTIQVTADDACPALADDSTCSQQIVVVCPTEGDTVCDGLTVEGPDENAPGIYRVTVAASDSSGDAIIYSGMASNGVDNPIVVHQVDDPVLRFTLGAATWDISVTVDDTPFCDDASANPTCEDIVEVVPRDPIPGEPLLLIDVGCGIEEPGWTQIDTCGEFPDVDGTGIDVRLETGNPAACACRTPGSSPDLDLPNVEEDLLFADDEVDTPGADFIVTFIGLDRGVEYAIQSIHNRSDEGNSVIQGVEVTGASDVDAPDEIIHGPMTVLEPAQVRFTAEDDEVSIRYLSPVADGPAPQQTILNGFILIEVESSPGGVPFQRGNANGDANFDLSDGVFVLNFLFLGGTQPTCEKALDGDDSGELDLTDGVFVLNHLFLGGNAPPPPGTNCGLDATPDALTCGSFPACN